MPRRRSSSDTRRSFSFGDLQDFEDDALQVAESDSGGGGLDRYGAIAERLGFEAGGVQFGRDAGVFDLLARRSVAGPMA